MSAHDIVYDKSTQERFLKGLIELFINSKKKLEDLSGLFLGISIILHSINIMDYSDECEWRIASPHIYMPSSDSFVPTDLPIHQISTSRQKPTYEILEFDYSVIESITLGPSSDHNKNHNILKKLFYDLKIDMLKVNYSTRRYRHFF